MTKARGWTLACAVLALAGCGSNNPAPTDAGMVVDTDGGATGTDAGSTPTLPVASVMGGGAPDFSCLGTRTAPAAGAEIAVTAAFTEAVSGSTLPNGTSVDIFRSNIISETCAAPDCTTVTANAMGEVMAMLPASAWFAYRVAGSTATTSSAPVTTIGYNRGAPAAAGSAGQSYISRQTIGLIPGLFGRMRVPGTTIVSGAIYDCADQPIAGAIARVFRDGTEILSGTGAMDPFAGYFAGATPSMRARNTDAMAGRFAFANIDVTPDPVRVELWAVRTEGAAPERIACEEVQPAADAVVIITELPLRADYAAGSGCGS